jgi:hypothetical protein
MTSAQNIPNSTVTLRISSQERQYPEDTPLGWVAETMTALEYIYNILAVVDLIEQRRILDYRFIELESIFRSSSQLGFPSVNLVLRDFIQSYFQAQLEGLEVGMSFTIKFGGRLEKVIDTLAGIFDPARRRAQREEDRHRATMNRWEEEDMKTQVLSRRLELIVEMINAPESRFNHDLEAQLGFERTRQLKQNMLDESTRGLKALGMNEAEVIEDSA